jgi:acyl-CoA thioesterase II
MPDANLPPLLKLDRIAAHRYRGAPEHDGEVRNVVFGGQILAQMIAAALADRRARSHRAEKDVKSIHATFARSGNYQEPIDYLVECMHDGRALGSDTVTFSQRDKVMARSLILWSADEPDLIRHTEQVSMPDVPGPDDPTNRPDRRVFPAAEGLIVGGLDTWSDDQPLHPPIQHLWTRLQGFAGPVPLHQAVLAWATDGFLIGTSMLPHLGYHEGRAHRTISTGVVGHTLNFHQRFDASEWHLLSNEAIWAGRGRIHGRGTVWSQDGDLVATYTQDSLVRAWPDGGDHTADYTTIM